LPRKIPNFSWGVEGKRYNLDLAIKEINNWKIMKNKALTKAEIDVLHHLFHLK
jgi:hypothetical protein